MSDVIRNRIHRIVKTAEEYLAKGDEAAARAVLTELEAPAIKLALIAISRGEAWDY